MIEERTGTIEAQEERQAESRTGGEAALKGLLVVNPIAGRAAVTRFLVPKLIRHLRGRGVDLDVRETRYAGHAAEIVERDASRFDRVIVIGGDGTIGEVVQGMGENPVPLCIIPLGTANCLALDLGIPGNPFEAADAIVDGRAKPIDVGYVNGKAFVLMVSSGIDAYTVHHMNNAVKRTLGKLGYVVSGIYSLFSYRSRRVRISLETTGVKDSGYFVIVANSRYYGGKISLDPDAVLDDGLFNVVLFKRPSILQILRLLFGVLTGTHKTMPDVVVYRDRAVKLSARRSIFMQSDGDKLPFRTASIRIRERFLPVMVPLRGI